MHVWGSRDYETDDDSRNNMLVALLVFGDGEGTLPMMHTYVDSVQRTTYIHVTAVAVSCGSGPHGRQGASAGRYVSGCSVLVLIKGADQHWQQVALAAPQYQQLPATWC